MRSLIKSFSGTRAEAFVLAFFFNILALLAFVLARTLLGLGPDVRIALLCGLLLLPNLWLAYRLLKGMGLPRRAGMSALGYALSAGATYGLHSLLFVGDFRDRDFANLFWLYFMSQLAVWEVLHWAWMRTGGATATPVANPVLAEGETEGEN